MRLVLFGSGGFGLPTFKRLAALHEVVGVVTQPDKPAGRGGKLSPTPVGEWAAAHLPNVTLLKPPKVNEPSVVEEIRSYPADAWVVIAFGQKLSQTLLKDRFAINLHASLLPRWRGAAPINAAILGGDQITGNTVITLAERMDAGQILGSSRLPIDPLITAGELHDLLADQGPQLVEKVLTQHLAGTLRPQPQDESLVTIATKLSKSDDHVDFAQRADFVRRQVHALTPWPGVTIRIVPPGTPAPPEPVPGEAPPPKPGLEVKVRRVQAVSVGGTAHQEDPGTLIDPVSGIVACGHHSLLKVLEVQPPGRNVMPWADFARGAGRTIVAGSRMAPAREFA